MLLNAFLFSLLVVLVNHTSHTLNLHPKPDDFYHATCQYHTQIVDIGSSICKSWLLKPCHAGCAPIWHLTRWHIVVWFDTEEYGEMDLM